MALTLTEIPVFTDVPDADISATMPLTDKSIANVSKNAKFAAIRCEILFMGFYAHGNTIPRATSPVDGYVYLNSEMSFSAMMFSNRSPDNTFVPGQLTLPTQSSSQPQNGPYNFPGGWDINSLTGVVNLKTSYYSGGGAEVVTTDGILKVYAICQRGSITLAD